MYSSDFKNILPVRYISHSYKFKNVISVWFSVYSNVTDLLHFKTHYMQL